MINTGQGYSPDQRGEFHGTLTPIDAEPITITDEDILAESVVLTENCCDRSFNFGQFISAQLEMSVILGEQLRSPLLKRARLTLSRKYYNDPGVQTADIPLGHFYVDDASVKRSKKSASFIAYDAAVYFDRPVVVPDGALQNVTPYAFIKYACDYVNAALTVTFGSGETFSMAQTEAQISGFPNAARLFSWKHKPEEQITCRDMVCSALQIMGAWGRINRYGQFEIRQFGLSGATYTIDGDNSTARTISDYPMSITGVTCDGTTVGNADGQLYDLSGNLLIGSVGSEAKSAVLTDLNSSGNVTGLGIYTADISWFGDPAVETGDAVIYSETDEESGIRSIPVIVMENRFRAHGVSSIKSFGSNKESGRVQTLGSSSGGDLPYISSNIVYPNVSSLQSYVESDLMGGFSFSPMMTLDEYDQLIDEGDFSSTTIYIVSDDTDDTIKMFLGDQPIAKEGGGGGGGENVGTIECAAVLSARQMREWAPNHDLVPVWFRGNAAVYYGQPPAKMVIQGQRANYGSPEITAEDIMSEITFEFRDGTVQKLKVYINHLYYNSMTLGVLCYDVTGAETFVGSATVSTTFTFGTSAQIGMILTVTELYANENYELAPRYGIMLAVRDGDEEVQTAAFPGISGSGFTGSNVDFGNAAERGFASGIARRTEPSGGE